MLAHLHASHRRRTMGNPIAYLLRDEFTVAESAPMADPRACDPGPGTLDITDTGTDLSITNGRLLAAGGASAWNDPAAWSAALDAGNISALVATFRYKVAAGDGPGLFLASAAAPANPKTGAYGPYHSGNNKIICCAPVILIGGTDQSVGIPNVYAHSIDFTFAMIRRPGGSGGFLVLVSGGAYGTWPAATLLWVVDTDSLTAAYAGIAAYSGQWAADSLRVRATPVTGVTGRWSLAQDYDTFTRADGAIGNTEGTGAAWTVESGGATIVSNKAVLWHASNACYVSIPVTALPRITEVKITTPGSGNILAGVSFRHISTADRLVAYIRRGDANIVAIMQDSSVVASYPFTPAYSTTYRLSVHDYGTYVRVFIDDTCYLNYATSDNSNALKVAIMRSTPTYDDGSIHDDFAIWPATITLPVDLADRPAVPAGYGSAVAEDAFTDANSTALADHDAAWSTAGGGTWEIQSNKAQMSAATATGVAYRAAGAADIEVQATITVPAGAPVVNDWYCGIYARYTDANNWIKARYIYQGNSPEIEIIEANGGVEHNYGAVNLGAGNLAAGSSHTIKLAVVGSRAAAYHEGELVLQVDVTLLTGTNAGIGVHETNEGQASYDDFSVKLAS